MDIKKSKLAYYKTGLPYLFGFLLVAVEVAPAPTATAKPTAEDPNSGMSSIQWGIIGAVSCGCLILIYIAFLVFRHSRKMNRRLELKRQKLEQRLKDGVEQTAEITSEMDTVKTLQLPSDYGRSNSNSGDASISGPSPRLSDVPGRSSVATTAPSSKNGKNKIQSDEESLEIPSDYSYSKWIDETVTPTHPTTLSAYMTQSSNQQVPQTLATLTNNEKELALPGYMQIDVEEDLLIQGVIGEGGFSKIFAASIQNPKLTERAGSNVCVLKVLDFGATEQAVSAFQQEVAIMAYFENRTDFAQMIGYNDSPAAICMRYYPMGSLDRWIYQKKSSIPYTVPAALKFACNIISAIKEMHDVDFVHCDIKPNNVLLSNHPQLGVHAVLTDFGISKIVSKQVVLVDAFTIVKVKGVSVAYSPPEAFDFLFGPLPTESEILGQQKTTQQINHELKAWDIYMFGVLLFEMITQETPFHDIKNVQQIAQMIVGGKRPTVPTMKITLFETDPLFMDIFQLIQRCWDQEPANRPPAKDVLQRLTYIRTMKRSCPPLSTIQMLYSSK